MPIANEGKQIISEDGAKRLKRHASHKQEKCDKVFISRVCLKALLTLSKMSGLKLLFY
jgi:hypothetical protein